MPGILQHGRLIVPSSAGWERHTSWHGCSIFREMIEVNL